MIPAAMAMPSQSYGQASTCNPSGPLITISPPGTTYAVGQKPRIGVQFGASDIVGGTQAEITTLRVSLDCANGTNPCTVCNDEGAIIKYSGDATIIHDLNCGGAHTVASNVPSGGAGTNVLVFTFDPPITLGPNQTCSLSFEVEVLAVGGDAQPKIINGFVRFEGECDNAAQFLNGCGTYSYSITNPGIRIVKDVSPTPICQNESVTYTYSVDIPSPFNTRLCNILVVDDNATPGDQSPESDDDFSPTYTGGDNNPENDCLDVGEVWTYSYGPVAMTTAGTFLNTAEVTGQFTNALGTIEKSASDDAEVVVHPRPVCFINSSADKICPGQTATMCVIASGGTPPYTYVWNTDDTSQCLIEVGTPGLYSVTVTDFKGCTTTCEFNLLPHEVDVEIVCSPKGEQIELCADVLSGRPPIVYRWSTSETTQCILVSSLPPCTTYLVTATDSNNCTDTDVFDLIPGPGSTCECPGSIGQCPADMNDDMIVGAADLLIVINAWGPCPIPPEDCPEDIAPQPTPDGVVGAGDLLRVINSWGPCG